MDRLADLVGPGLVLLVIAFWLVRKIVKAAGTERELEAEQERLASMLQAHLPDLPRPLALVPPPAPLPGPGPLPGAEPSPPAGPFAAADLASAAPAHVAVVRSLVTERLALPGAARLEVLWVRSVGQHAAWCERRQPAQVLAEGMAAPGLVREVLCVAQIEGGKVVARSTFG